MLSHPAPLRRSCRFLLQRRKNVGRKFKVKFIFISFSILNNFSFYLSNRTFHYSYRRPRSNQTRSKISKKRVEELLSFGDANKILLELDDEKFGFNEYMQTPTMGDVLIKSFLQLLNKAFECNTLYSKKLKLIEKLAVSNYFNELVYKNVSKNTNGVYDLEFIRCVITILNSILRMNPSRLSDLKKVIDNVEIVIMLRIQNKDLEHEFMEKIVKIIQDIQLQEQQKKNIKQSKVNLNNADLCESHEPPENIKIISILPTLDEINSKQRPYLRKNIVNGAYKNVDHYLDIQFRLLREDFLKPLRDGITEFRALIKKEKEKNSKLTDANIFESGELKKKISYIDGLKAYFNVSFISSMASDEGIELSIQLDINKCKNVAWELSKQFMYGSLVCLSNDFFNENLILAVISDRDTKKLKRGIITVRLERQEESCYINEELIVNENSKYILFETEAFYEAYSHVLKALKTFQEHTFPFKEQIVDCNPHIAKPPLYLANSMNIDFRTLVDKNNHTTFDHTTGVIKFEFNMNLNYASCCNIYNERRWPSPGQMNLDDSQYQAIKLALRQQIALIQGPPGTGKTFIGVKLVKLLLNNSNLWKTINRSEKPILMLCYTNHALDQFLEYCVSDCHLTDGVVRIGSRCKNENLQRFFLKNIRSKFRKERRIEKSLFNQCKDERLKLNRLKNMLISYYKIIENSKKGILKLDLLRKYMETYYFDQLENDFKFLDWIFFNSFFEKSELINEFEDNFDNFDNEQLLDFTDESESLKNENSQKEPTDDDYDDEDFEKDNIERMLDNDDLDLIENLQIAKFLNKDVFTQSDLQKIEHKIKAKQNAFIKVIDYKKLLKNIIENKNEKNIYTHDLWSLSIEDRICLYTHWVNMLRNDIFEKIQQLKPDLIDAVKNVTELRMQEDLYIMQKSYIVAMTTTASARYHNILRDLGSPIVIIEEAAEVLESHIISSLSQHCQHLILIGDHVQLKPKPNVYELETEYNMNVSLFERLANNKFECATLSCQRRMRPEISILMKHFYNIEIINHESVKNRENILGLAKNVEFVHHTNLEDHHDDNSNFIWDKCFSSERNLNVRKLAMKCEFVLLIIIKVKKMISFFCLWFVRIWMVT